MVIVMTLLSSKKAVTILVSVKQNYFLHYFPTLVKSNKSHSRTPRTLRNTLHRVCLLCNKSVKKCDAKCFFSGVMNQTICWSGPVARQPTEIWATIN